jgi:DNA repair exonuclease SbcCD ATPase subunit
MITLKELQWSNCFSYGPDNVLALDSNTLTQIIGTNGMGKSSIPLIIEEVCYNKNSKGIKKADIPNRYVNNGYFISLTFTKDDDEYKITVDRKTSIKVKLEKNGKDISSHTATNTYKSLQDIIGIDFKTFSQLVYQNTNASLQFLTATDTNRKKFLIDLLHLEEYVKLFDIFKEAARELNIEVRAAQSQIDTIEKWLSDNKLTDTTILPMLNLEINTDTDEKQLRQLTTEIEKISETNKKISKNNQFKDLLKQINVSDFQNLNISGIESYDDMQTEIGRWQSRAAEAREVLKGYKEVQGSFVPIDDNDTCPTCGQEIDLEAVDKIASRADAMLQTSQVNIGELRLKIDTIKKNNKIYQDAKKLEQQWTDIYRSIDHDAPATLVDQQELETKLKEVSDRLTEAKTKIKEIAEENAKRTARNTRIEVIQEQTDNFTEELKQVQKKLKEIDTSLSNVEVLKKAFSTNGLLAYKIENLVKDLEELTNSYLAELSDGRFTLEFVVSNDKLNVQITDNGKSVDILALSTGELARVNTATLIAIRKLMSSISKSRINILFLDEVMNVLDEAGREKLVEVLLGEELNTYIVSHGWTHPLLDKIEVVKEGNISQLEM